MTFLEYRILKEYSKFPKGYLCYDYKEGILVNTAIFQRNFDIHRRTKIKLFVLITITNQLITDEYLSRDGEITILGKTELHFFWKKWFKKGIESLCKIYLPLLISIAAIVISIIALKKP